MPEAWPTLRPSGFREAALLGGEKALLWRSGVTSAAFCGLWKGSHEPAWLNDPSFAEAFGELASVVLMDGSPERLEACWP